MLRLGNKITQAFAGRPNPYASTLTKLTVDGKDYKYYSLPSLGDKKLGLFLNGFVISIYLYKTHNCFDLISDNFTTLLVEFLIHYSINTMLIILLVYILHYIHNKKDIFDDKLVLLEHQENQEIYNLEEQKNLTNI